MNEVEDFFKSEIVQQCIEEINDLQMEIMIFSQYSQFASDDEKRDHLKVLRHLTERQKNLYYRCHLSDSPGAKRLMRDVDMHFVEMGFEQPDTPADTLLFFDRVNSSIDELEEELDERF
jgi:hypothetical protein